MRLYSSFIVYSFTSNLQTIAPWYSLFFRVHFVVWSRKEETTTLLPSMANRSLSFMSRISLSALTFPIRSPLRNLYSVTFQITELLCCILNHIASARSSFMLLLEEYVLRSSMVTFIYCIANKKWGKKKPHLFFRFNQSPIL